MHEQNNRRLSPEKNSNADISNQGRGPQGIDKAPGEETAQGTENVTAQTQKGKNKVDGDPEKESDRPVENE